MVHPVDAATKSASRQAWSAKSYEDNVRFVSVYGEGVLGWLAPKCGIL